MLRCALCQRIIKEPVSRTVIISWSVEHAKVCETEEEKRTSLCLCGAVLIMLLMLTLGNNANGTKNLKIVLQMQRPHEHLVYFYITFSSRGSLKEACETKRHEGFPLRITQLHNRH